MPSVTTWARLEPRAQDSGLRISLQAQVHDPLWFLARQWQLGEFMGEDVGSPITARLRAECAFLDRFGVIPPGGEVFRVQPYDSAALPLETLVEREPMRGGSRANARLTAEAGLHFFRLLAHHGVSQYRTAYLTRYPFAPPTSGERRELDPESLRFFALMAGRIPDAPRLQADLLAALRPPGGVMGDLPPQPPVAAADRDQVRQAVLAWLDYMAGGLFSEPPGPLTPWNHERMEYTFAVAARPPAVGEVVLGAPEYDGQYLDWDSFVLLPGVTLGSAGSVRQITRTVIPAPVSYHGMPASRWWAFEDAMIDFGAIQAGPPDLAHLFLIEFGTIYGNDWFNIPVDVPAGSLCFVRSLVVTNTFGERTLVLPYTQVDGTESPWRMFQLSPEQGLEARVPARMRDLFFLPPSLGSSLEGSPLEDVLFIRDEMANDVWGIERIAESPAGRPLRRYEAYQAERERLRREQEAMPPREGTQPAAPLSYRLMSTVPDYWIPFVPVAIAPGSIRLQRGQILRIADGTPIRPRGVVLEPERSPFYLFEEEVPRAGTRVTRSFQYARWIDGSTHLWVGRRRQTGRGEGSSGLRFDIVEKA